ncbi:MAG: flagellar hook-associated protein 3 FlgL [Halanaerobiales bacterium]|nr:flagellar hook-associated protein 3 FlgL [Halanaerobiales bacterium]
MTRITNNIIINDFMKNYRESSRRLNKYMNQLSNGAKFSQISDNAIDAAKSLKLETTIKFNNQYADNAETGIRWLAITDQALDDVVKTLRRIRDIAVKGANGTWTNNERAKMQEEVEQIKKHLIEIGNSKYGDRYIFNGTKTKIKPYKDGNTINPADYLDSGTISQAQIKREIFEGSIVEINISGKDVGNGGFSQIFADLKELSNSLATGDIPGINNSISKIDQHIEKTLAARARVGARQQRLELVKTRLETQEVEYSKILSNTKDVDIPETIMKLKNEENVYRAALAVGARIIMPSLINFLK